MKKTYLILSLLISSCTFATPAQVAANIFNEYKQVVETIKQLVELKKQLEAKAEQIKTMSGKKEFIVSELERQLRNWHPRGDELYDPPESNEPGTYDYEFNDLEDSMDLFDLIDLLGLDGEDDIDNPNYVKYKARDGHRKATLAASAYGKVALSQGMDRFKIIKDYLNMIGNAATIKESTDIQTQIIAQAAYNQAEINKTMAMLLQLKSTQGQKELAQERWYNNLLKKR